MERTFQTNRFLLMWCSVLLLLLAFRTASAQSTGSNSSGVTSDDQPGGDDDQRSSMEKGMEPFYDFVKSFLGVVQPNRLADQSWLNLSQLVKGDYDEDEISDWKNWAEYLMGFVVCVALGVLFFLVMPIAGLVFCCCRCAGKCGGKPKPQDPKHARCKRTTYCTLLLVLNTVALAGVVCAFLSNEIVYDKLQNLNSDGPTGKIIKSADTVNMYTNNTIEDIEEKILQQFVDSSVKILDSIGESAVNAVDGVLETLKVDKLLFNSKELAKGVIRSLDDIANVATQLEFLNAQGALLADNLTEIKGELDGLCTSPPAVCPGYDPTQYTLEANFTGLGELETEASNLNESANLAEEIIVAEESINATKDETTQSVQNNIDSSQESVNEVETSLRKGVNDIKKNLQDVVTAEVDKFRSQIEDLQDDIADYSEYVWYAGIGICSALLLVVVVYYVGILFGLCGERPGYGAPFCNTGAGANFLLAGVGMTFLLTWLIMLVCMVLFVVGGPMYTELCRYFDDHQPRELQPFSDALFDALDWQDSLFDGKDVDLDIVNVLKGCENDEAIYSVLRLDYMVNLTEITDLSAMHDALDELKNESLNIPNVTVVTPAMNESISNYAKAGLEDIVFDEYYAEINKSLTPVDLQEMARQVRDYTSPALPPNTNDSLNSIADRLEALHTQYVVPMQEAEESLEESITSLKERADAGIESTTNALLRDLLDAQDEFNSKKDKLVKDEVDKLIDGVMAETEDLVKSMLNDVYNTIGKCRPVYDSFYTVSDAACIAALEPLNAVWFSIGWCLFFFVPALIFAIKLAGLYRREHEERDFDDPNFNHYLDGKQDSIPLTSRQQRSERGRQSGGDDGMTNRAYQDDSHMGPSDYPNYKGKASAPDPTYEDGYMRPLPPPPYGGHQGDVNGNQRGRDQRMYPY